MSTLRQIEANRRNAQKSTGPTSVTGKAASSMNALKTGIHAKSLVLPSENPAELEQLIDEYYQQPRPHHPRSPLPRRRVHPLRVAPPPLPRRRNPNVAIPERKRIPRSGEVPPRILRHPARPNAFSKLQYRVDSTRRARERVLQSLKQLQAETAAETDPPPDPPEAPAAPSLTPSLQTTSPVIGFVPPNPRSSPTPARTRPPQTTPSHP